jgi:hypothetical protein
MVANPLKDLLKEVQVGMSMIVPLRGQEGWILWKQKVMLCLGAYELLWVIGMEKSKPIKQEVKDDEAAPKSKEQELGADDIRKIKIFVFMRLVGILDDSLARGFTVH